MKNYIYAKTPLGIMTLVEENEAITALRFKPEPISDSIENETPVLVEARCQLTEYFCGMRKRFTVPLNPVGTVFQRSVWDALLEIPYGTTTTYKAVANKIHQPCAARAVGMANNMNPIPIMIPCHRVLGAKGIIKGYAGGIEMMRFLLELEQRFV